MAPKTGKEALLAWAKKCGNKFNVQIDNFSKSWKDGKAFCAIFAYYYPEFLDFSKCENNSAEENLKLAFSVGKKVGVEALLDPEDILDLPVPDQFSVMTYLSQCYHQLVNNGRGAGIASIVFDSTSTPTTKPVQPIQPKPQVASNICTKCQKPFSERPLKVKGLIYCNICGREEYMNLVQTVQNNKLFEDQQKVVSDEMVKNKSESEKENEEREREKREKEKEEREKEEKEEREKKEKEKEKEERVKEKEEKVGKIEKTKNHFLFYFLFTLGLIFLFKLIKKFFFKH